MTSDHPIFSTDPAEHVQYVGKRVRVTGLDGGSPEGWVYTVDPVSQSVVLAIMSEDGESITHLTVVMGHSVKDIQVLDEDTEKHREQLDRLFRCDLTENVSPEEMLQRMQTLKSWLLKNRLPVTVSKDNADVLDVADVLTIHSPYGPDNCVSTNEIILGRIQGLIKNMPKDVDSW